MRTLEGTTMRTLKELLSDEEDAKKTIYGDSIYDIIYKYFIIEFDSVFYSEFEELDEKDINKFIRYIYYESRSYMWNDCIYIIRSDDKDVLVNRIKELSEHYSNPHVFK